MVTVSIAIMPSRFPSYGKLRDILCANEKGATMSKMDKERAKAADDALFEALGKSKKRKKRKLIITVVSVVDGVATEVLVSSGFGGFGGMGNPGEFGGFGGMGGFPGKFDEN